MKFDFKKYIEYFNEMKLSEAGNYRKSNIPSKLYKYVSLAKVCDNSGCTLEEKNNKELENIKQNKLWMTNYKNLNDPFECKMLYLDRKRLEEAGWTIEYANKAFDYIKDVNLIASFTTHLDDSLPMWAHYANNHRGICIEYDVISTANIYPVSYEKSRIPIATTITQAITRLSHFNECHEEDSQLNFYMEILYLAAIMKDKAWEYEDEYRALYLNEDRVSGKAITVGKLGLRASRIFIGMNCEERYRERLIDISKALGCSLFQMYFDEEVGSIKLSYRKV